MMDVMSRSTPPLAGLQDHSSRPDHLVLGCCGASNRAQWLRLSLLTEAEHFLSVGSIDERTGVCAWNIFGRNNYERVNLPDRWSRASR
jgi:hypothetical protein